MHLSHAEDGSRMALLQRFWSWLTAPRAPAPRQGHPELRPLDVEALTRELDLLAEARRLGAAGLPQPDARTLAGPEAVLVQRVEKTRQDHVDWAVLRLGILEQDIARQGAALALRRAREADREFEHEAADLLAEQEGVLRDLREAALNRRAELAEFRARNGLHRDADYPSPSTRVLLAGLLVLVVVLEGLANSFFFAAGVNSGLLGGFVYAALFAAINIALAYALGKYGVREIAHVRPLRRAAGVAALAFAVGAMVAIGLGIAHVRDALTAGLPDATEAALRSLRANPFELNGVPSWGLFVVSVLFAAFALVDGLKTDDPYPGYGRLARRARLALEDHDAELDDVRAGLEAMKTARLAALDRDLQRSQAALAVLESLIGEKRATGSRLANALRDADNSLDALLRRFRTENELHRAPAPRPAYFDTLPRLRPLKLPEFDTSADEAALAEQRGLLAAALAEVQGLRARIQAIFDRQVERLRLSAGSLPAQQPVPAREAA
jgi:hypothetical protein